MSQQSQTGLSAEDELELRMAALDLEFRNYALTEVNVEFEEKLKKAEQHAQMANKKLEATIQEIQQRMDKFTEEMAIQQDEQQKEMHNLEDKHVILLKMLEDAEGKAQMAKNELEEAVRANQHKMEEFGTEMAIQQKANIGLLEEKMQQEIVESTKESLRKMDKIKEEFVKMLSSQNEHQLKRMAQLETKYDALQEENKDFANKQQEAEQKAQMANNQVEAAIKEIQQKMRELDKEMANQNAQHQKEKRELEERNEHLLKMLTDLDVDGKAKMATNETMHKLAQFEAEFFDKLAFFEKEQKKTLAGNKQENGAIWEVLRLKEQKMAEFGEEIAKLKMQQKKARKVGNPRWNHWNCATTGVPISPDGLSAENTRGGWQMGIFSTNEWHWEHVFAQRGFPIRRPNDDGFVGTRIYYYEVTRKSPQAECLFRVGYSAGSIPAGSFVGGAANSFALQSGHHFCTISGKAHEFEWPNGQLVEKPEWTVEGGGDAVIGCGLLLNAEEKVALFFTLNGILLGKQMPICPSVDFLFPTVSIFDVSLVANFGQNPGQPFEYDIDTCPGLVIDF